MRDEGKRVESGEIPDIEIAVRKRATNESFIEVKPIAEITENPIKERRRQSVRHDIGRVVAARRHVDHGGPCDDRIGWKRELDVPQVNLGAFIQTSQ